MIGMDQIASGAPPQPIMVQDGHFVTVPDSDKLTNTLYQNCEFDNVNWSGISLVDIRFINCRFVSNVFSGCAISNVVCSDGSMHGVEWADCAINMMVLSDVSVQEVRWKGGNLNYFTCEKMHGASLGFEDVKGAHVSLIECELTGILLRGGHWTDTSWVGGKLTNGSMQSVKFERFITAQSGLDQWEISHCVGSSVSWMSCSINALRLFECRFSPVAWGQSEWSNGRIESCELPMAHFGSAILTNIEFVNVNMQHAIFDKACITDCDMSGIWALGTSLRSAQLQRVNLSSVHMQGLDAREAVLNEVDLSNADCTGACLIGQSRSDWRYARIDKATFDEPQKYNDPQDYDDKFWWKQVQPGARGNFS